LKEEMMNDDIDWYGPDMATFGDRLAAARENAQMTRTQLARRLGVKAKTIEGWENDTSEPRANRLSMLAGLLGVSIMWLINGEGEGIDNPEMETDTNSDMASILTEVRDVKVALKSNMDRLARLEKKLRQNLQD
jgi:transcriptional regulator with XRE-family HTH domain